MGVQAREGPSLGLKVQPRCSVGMLSLQNCCKVRLQNPCPLVAMNYFTDSNVPASMILCLLSVAAAAKAVPPGLADKAASADLLQIQLQR